MGVIREVVIPYTPRDAFWPFHERTKRWASLVVHRRAGKTVATVNDLIKGALTCTNKDPRFAYIAPLYKQAKDVVWQYLKYYALSVPGAVAHESELRVDFPNGGRVRLYGADNPDALRGIYLDGVALDEYADMNPRVWGEVIRPALSDRKGWAVFIGTPKGKNAFYDLHTTAEGDDSWFSMLLPASKSGLIDDEELADARKSMTEEQFEQEFECSFSAAIQGAYYGKYIARAEAEGRVTDVPYQPNRAVQTMWDIGIGQSDGTAVWFFQQVGDWINFIDYHEGVGEGLPYYAKVLQDRGYFYGKHHAPHDIRNNEWGSGRARIEIARSLGLTFHIAPNIPIIDGINAVRLLFPRFRFDQTKCAAGLEALRQYRQDWDDDRKCFRDKPRHDWTSHPADAVRIGSLALQDEKGHVPPPVRNPTMDEMVSRHLQARAAMRSDDD
jgi:hypothetical protein